MAAHVRTWLAPVAFSALAALAAAQVDEWFESVTLSQSRGLPPATAWCAGATAVLPPAQDPVLMRWPYVTNVVTGEADVVFGLYGDQPRPAEARVDFWTEATGERGAIAVPAEYTSRQWIGYPIPVNTTVTMHQYRASFRNVTAATEVCYRVVVDGNEVVGGLRFRSAPERGDASRPIRFIGYGDFGVSTLAEGQVANALWARLDDAEFTAILGDDTYFNGKGHEYHKRTFPYYASQWASKAVVPVSGNHDYQYDDDDLPTQYLATFGLRQSNVAPEHAGRYYSFDWGHVHFSVLDTEWTGFDTERKMNQWLRADLAAAQDQPWRVVLYHKTPYVYGTIADLNVYRELLPIFEEGNVHMALGGHWHHYARYPAVRGDVPTPVSQGGVMYVISGGGGYPTSDKGGEMVALKDGRVVYVPSEGEQSHHARIPADTGAAAPDPDVYLSVHHFVAWSFGNCTATQETIDIDGNVVDTVTIDRCT